VEVAVTAVTEAVAIDVAWTAKEGAGGICVRALVGDWTAIWVGDMMTAGAVIGECTGDGSGARTGRVTDTGTETGI
jgi:hypothetical protein